MRGAVGLLTLLALSRSSACAQTADEDFFEARIRPVLAATCFKCHGGGKTSGGLRVDSRAALLEGGDRGPALVPGEPEKSRLILALRHRDKDFRMPPDKALPAHVVDDFAAWIKRGAPWSKAPDKGFAAAKHWAFEPVKAPAPPADATGWAEHPIDRFIAAGLRKQGLTPVAAADRRTLFRRACFDLIGLPPTPAEMDAFLKDEAPDAFAKAVDRLLASPHYGERWGRWWMDVVRYADTAGDNADYPIPEVHRYRDYIIDAFNNDKPFNEFIVEQLAGDILAKSGPAEKYAERVIATGFLALSRRYATAPYELWHLSLEDAIDTTGQAFLGLTLRCARCHDHKFDPLSREDYYGLFAIFANTNFAYAGSEEFASMKKPREKFVPLTLDGDKHMGAYRKRLEDIASRIKRLETEKSPERQKELSDLRAEERVLFRHGGPLDVPLAYAVSDGKPVVTHIHLRGDPDQPGPVAPRRVPKFLEREPVTFPADQSGRLELARWIARADNPLTARVIVNRVWQYHFGRGIVPTPNNFGLRGEAPSHPELLDHLTAEFVRHGWSIKWLHRHIMQSKTYQLGSAPSPELLAKDPGNVWLGRFSRHRLDAEALRDALLAVSGKLDTKRPGPHPFPPITTWGWTQHNPFKDIYPSNHRSVYLMTQRFQKHPFLALFDGPDTNASTEKRTSSLLPGQALFLMNHPFVREQAEGLARRLMAHDKEASRRIAWAHHLAWSRPATEEEIGKGVDYVRRYSEGLRGAGTPGDQVELEAWLSFSRVMLTANEFVMID